MTLRSLRSRGPALIVLVLAALVGGAAVSARAAEQPAQIEALAQRLASCEQSLATQQAFLESAQRFEQEYRKTKQAYERAMAEADALLRNQWAAGTQCLRARKAQETASRALAEAQGALETADARCAQGTDAVACAEARNLRAHVIGGREARARSLAEERKKACARLDEAGNAWQTAWRERETPAKVAFLQAKADYEEAVLLGYGPKAHEELRQTQEQCDGLRAALAAARSAAEAAPEPAEEEPFTGKRCTSEEVMCSGYCCPAEIMCWDRPAVARAVKDGRCR